jgi:2-dehydropantoate 2-reductase
METETYKFGIIGLGPVGQILAIHLKEAGFEVALTDLDIEKLNLIRRSGIELVDKIQKQAYFSHIYNSVGELLENDFDILISCVKAYHVCGLIAEIERISRKPRFLVNAQNGLEVKCSNSDNLKDTKIFRLVVNYAGNLQAPNITSVSFFGKANYIASVDDFKHEITDQIAKRLSKVGLRTENVDSFEIVNKIWEKAILNAALSPFCAISKQTMKEAVSNSDTIEIVEMILKEAVEVSRAEGIKLPENFIQSAMQYLKNAGNHFPSLAVDLMSKKPTEIDYMNGKIVEFGRKHNIKTTINLTLTNLVKAISHQNLHQ